MEDSIKIKQRFELLKMARELLNEEYINRRAEDHNKWVAENEELWRTSRRNLPYPPFAQYPTDDEIVKTASNLYNFIFGTGKEAEPDVNITTVDEVVEELPTEIPNIIHEEPVINNTVEEIEEEQHEPIREEMAPGPTLEDIKSLSAKVSAARKFLPGWIRRTDNVVDS